MTIIFKIQRPLSTTEPVDNVLVYNETRTREGFIPMTREVKNLFGKKHKLFVYGKQDAKGVVSINGIAPWQEW